MGNVMNIKVTCYVGTNMYVSWFKDVPEGIKYENLINKFNELKNVDTANATFEIEVAEIPYGVVPINWMNV